MRKRRAEDDRGWAADTISASWSTLPQEQYDLLLNSIEARHYERNEVIYKNEEEPQKVYCLLRGKVKIYKAGLVRDQIIRAIKPREMFGFRALFAKETYKTGAMVIERSLIASFPVEILMRLMAANFNVSLYFVRYLSVELGRSDDRTVNLTQKHMRGRMAESLMFLEQSYGSEADGKTLSIRLSREDLANLSNMTTSNCIRTLSSFDSEGIITTTGKSITINDYAMLKKISTQGN